jgi:hypothetical protein
MKELDPIGENICSGLCRNVRSRLSKNGERVKGIEPSSSAWKAVALPLSYTRVGRIPFALWRPSVKNANGSSRSERRLVGLPGYVSNSVPRAKS